MQPAYGSRVKSSRYQTITGGIGPVSMALLVNAGQLKTNPLFTWLPIDLTLAMLIVAAVSVLGALPKVGLRHATIAAPLMLIVGMVLGIFSASLDEYSSDKVLTFFTITFVLILGPFIVLFSQKQQRTFLFALLTISLFAALFASVFPSSVSAYTDRVAFEGADTIGTSRIAGVGLLICIIWMVSRDHARRHRVVYGIMALPLLLMMLQSGSRGPFVSLIGATLVVFLASPALRPYRMKALATLAACALVFAGIVLKEDNDGVRRILGFLTGERDTSSMTREFLWQGALNVAANNPFGVGWGDYGKTREISGSLYTYPHNLILEFLTEGGWLLALCIVAYIAVALLRGVSHANTSEASVVLGLLAFAVANAMVSGDMNDNRLMWLALSLAWMGPGRAVPVPPLGMRWQLNAPGR